jgi:hypothetical protein
VELRVRHVPRDLVRACRHQNLSFRRGRFDPRRRVHVRAVPAALEEFRESRVNADPQTQRSSRRLYWSFAQPLLDMRRAAHRFRRIVKRQEERVAHGAHFASAMRVVTRAHQLEVWRLHLFQVGVIALTIVSPQRCVPLGSAGLHHICKHHCYKRHIQERKLAQRVHTILPSAASQREPRLAMARPRF